MSIFQGLSVGRIVHYFTNDASKHSNGQGIGPYPAMVLQTFGDGAMGNLKVWTYDGGFVASSVSEKTQALKNGNNQWYEWPART